MFLFSKNSKVLELVFPKYNSEGIILVGLMIYSKISVALGKKKPSNLKQQSEFIVGDFSILVSKFKIYHEINKLNNHL